MEAVLCYTERTSNKIDRGKLLKRDSCGNDMRMGLQRMGGKARSGTLIIQQSKREWSRQSKNHLEGRTVGMRIGVEGRHALIAGYVEIPDKSDLRFTLCFSF